MMARTARTILTLLVLCSACAARADAPKKTPKEAAMSEAKKKEQADLKKRLTAEQYRVTQECGTERPFANEFWDNHAAGIYVDVVSGEPLFSSADKFDSGSGWPSFTRPIEGIDIVEKKDVTLGMERVEVRSKTADSHLGHVFDDGPGPTGNRYCINSASLRFVPANKLVEEGYEKFAKLFPGVKQTKEPTKPAAKPEAIKETAILAGGCFWGMENIIRKIPGVLDTEVGYTGGSLETPSYEDVTTGRTGHAEAVRVVFDPQKLSFEGLLGYFFRMHDPTTLNRQENDRGTQYRSAIFATSEEQKKAAEKVKEQVNRSGKWKDPVVTQIVAASKFYPAEGYHQDYLIQNPDGYNCHVLRD